MMDPEKVFQFFTPDEKLEIENCIARLTANIEKAKFEIRLLSLFATRMQKRAVELEITGKATSVPMIVEKSV